MEVSKDFQSMTPVPWWCDLKVQKTIETLANQSEAEMFKAVSDLTIVTTLPVRPNHPVTVVFKCLTFSAN